MKLDHVAIITSDYQKALTFYGLLGFTEIERVKRPFDIARLTEPEALGLRHLAFSTNDLDGKLEQLHQNGIETERIRTDLHGRRFTFLKDPDGLPIEIKEALPRK